MANNKQNNNFNIIISNWYWVSGAKPQKDLATEYDAKSSNMKRMPDGCYAVLCCAWLVTVVTTLFVDQRIGRLSFIAQNTILKYLLATLESDPPVHRIVDLSSCCCRHYNFSITIVELKGYACASITARHPSLIVCHVNATYLRLAIRQIANILLPYNIYYI